MQRRGRFVWGFGWQGSAEARLYAAVFNARAYRIGRWFAVARVCR